MRYITSSSSDAVTVATEIDYINKYLYCMQIRYQNNLKCVVDIDERIMSCAIPKLLIQPIVENAIKYGTDCIPPWTITISGTGTPSDWQITVSDTGNGFDGKTIEMLRSRMNECDGNLLTS
jgi:two-component system sensor histidine kinase YesM